MQPVLLCRKRNTPVQLSLKAGGPKSAVSGRRWRHLPRKSSEQSSRQYENSLGRFLITALPVYPEAGCALFVGLFNAAISGPKRRRTAWQ